MVLKMMSFRLIAAFCIALHLSIAQKNYHESLFHKKFDSVTLEGSKTPEQEKESAFWIQKSQNRIDELVRRLPILQKRAKNIILFMGDGMSLATLTAARILKGQRNGAPGEESSLGFENFPFSGLSKTYCTNSQVADSACTATALHCGVKTNVLTLGVNAKVNIMNCSSSMDPDNHVSSLAGWAQTAKKSTGIVTTTTVTHASPAGGYAHTCNRFYESDFDVYNWKDDPKSCQDIATQLMKNSPGKNFDVILGGGRQKFLPNTVNDSTGVPGERLDGVNLIEEWKRNHVNGEYVTNRYQLNNIDFKNTTHLLGLFQPTQMEFNLLADKSQQPSLEEMTESAIKILEKNHKGYFLFVESGRIDHGHHGTVARLALDETLELDKAVNKARSITSPLDTLIVVTSDHGHTMTIAGYSQRGNDILNVNDILVGSDSMPYMTLSYANGPKQYLDGTGKRIDISNSIDPFFEHPGLVPMQLETHGGEDVGVFASGPYAHYFSGVYEQSDIPHLMAFASCIGKGRTHCKKY